MSGAALSWAPEALQSDGEWSGNALRFASEAIAKDYARAICGDGAEIRAVQCEGAPTHDENGLPLWIAAAMARAEA